MREKLHRIGAVATVLGLSILSACSGGTAGPAATAATPAPAAATSKPASVTAAPSAAAKPASAPAAAARVTVTIGGSTLEFVGGQCNLDADEKYLAVELFPRLSARAGSAFTLVVGEAFGQPGGKPVKGGGPNKAQTLDFDQPDGSRFTASDATAELKGDLKGGIFSGKEPGTSGAQATGSFTC